MPAGRPTTYTPEINKAAEEYIENCPDVCPSVVGFACHISVLQRQLYKWAEKHDEFRRTLDKIVEEQHSALVNKGLSSQYNSNITKLMLSHNHGYTDKHDITSGGQSLADIAAIMGISDDDD